jgi:hypothetical protein
LQNFTPPALPRPPAWTCAFTITAVPYFFAIVSASAGVVATSPAGMGTPKPRRISFAWYSWMFTSVGLRGSAGRCSLAT